MHQRHTKGGTKHKAVSLSKFSDNFRGDFNLNVERGDVNAKVFWVHL